MRLVRKKKPVYENVLNIPEGKSGKFEIEHVTHDAGHSFPLVSMRTALMGGHKGAPVVFDHPTRWHTLLEDRGVWMSDYPIEQMQADQELKEITKGAVVVGGLGLGYVTTVLAKRDKISSVVVVEKSSDVLNLVADHVCADDEAARDKIEFVNADLFDYLGMLGPNVFDHACYDIWKGDGESTFFNTVVPLLRLSAGRVRHEPVCWNESVMRGQLYNSLSSRWAFAKGFEKGIWKKTSGMKDLEDLCTPVGSVWLDWSVAFFRWVRKSKPDTARFNVACVEYARGYGRRWFDMSWRGISGEEVLYPQARRGGEDVPLT